MFANPVFITPGKNKLFAKGRNEKTKNKKLASLFLKKFTAKTVDEDNVACQR